MSDPLIRFHPQIRSWFSQQFGAPTAIQAKAWPMIQAQQNTLLSAPTGSGKTLAAFLSAINQLLEQSLRDTLRDCVHILYISPLKALANDVHTNLEEPLSGIQGPNPSIKSIRSAVRTGDTAPAARQRMLRRPPHILATTPESLYILLTSVGGRALLCGVTSVIVDEIHALVDNKRGAHLALSLERLSGLCVQDHGSEPQRIGLSATIKPMAAVADFLVGAQRRCQRVDSGHMRQMDIAQTLTDSPLEAVMANEAWAEIYHALAGLIQMHRTTLIFVNTRRLAERAARHLAERLGDEAVTAHHGSLAKEHRLAAEQRLKKGQLRALVTTASLELGIDIGNIDLVCQLGSPRSLSAFLQRVGRSGHGVGRVPKARLFPLNRDEMIEGIALLDAIQAGHLDLLTPVDACLDVLAQQIVAEVSARSWDKVELFELVRRAWPYRALTAELFEQVLSMLAEGYATRRGRRGAYIFYDRVNDKLKARKGAALTAVSNGGVIPDQFDYEVILSPGGHRIGSLNEDFAFESLPGDIFQLGNTSYRILKIEQGKVHVADAKGQPPNIPFWFGESLGRTDALSSAVSQLRQQVDQRLEQGQAQCLEWLQQRYRLSADIASQCIDYMAKTKAVLGVIPNQSQVVVERFFDQTGDMHMVIHATFGSRINRAWGLALRKRFCRQFNFELQAAALEDSIILSLGPTHSFLLEEVAHYLHPDSVEPLLIQALLDVPLFATQWRWNASNALAIKRMHNGKRRPAQWQRSDGEDLLAMIFPDQLACLENIQGDREIPKHPLVQQTLYDCIHVKMDVPGLKKILSSIRQGEIEWIGRDLPQPSPLAQAILKARPYAFLDDAPAEERRTLAVQTRHLLDVEDAAQTAQLDPQAISRVQQEVWPEVTCIDDCHDALILLGYASKVEIQRHKLQDYLLSLAEQGRASFLAEQQIWVAADRLHLIQSLFAQGRMRPPMRALFPRVDPEQALCELVRARLECSGPVSVSTLAQGLRLPDDKILQALMALEQEGFVLRGHFTSQGLWQWCERRLLARINRYTVKALRKEIEAVSSADYMRFLLHWQQLTERGQGSEALIVAIQRLEGFAIPAAAWEKSIFPSRIKLYLPHMLDKLCTGGLVQWLRLGAGQGINATPLRNTPIVLLSRQNRGYWRRYAQTKEPTLSTKGQSILTLLRDRGALFLHDLAVLSAMLQTEVQQALAECVAKGLVSCDDYSGLRELISPTDKRRRRYAGRRLTQAFAVNTSGRWQALAANDQAEQGSVHAHEPALIAIAQALLQRYGVVFRKVLERENHIPPWRELLYILRRMEARGEVRGGRFVQGFSGEQFALPEALSELRRIRRIAPQQQWRVIAASDPLNLLGILLPGERIPAYLNSKILVCDGQPVAVQNAQSINYLTDDAKAREGQIRQYFINGNASHANQSLRHSSLLR